ncbi:hypothetical protein E6O75_ATG08923 [Venturia nashicola]|uniref:Uncharacterized protein n=1 Tax=Venturia nashicola TaxID=86259 RepID=A0A4Z1NJN6_9PEZI|nr:hypothetical protein E6O75_ATG08923 [Venturia nashicola]
MTTRRGGHPTIQMTDEQQDDDLSGNFMNNTSGLGPSQEESIVDQFSFDQRNLGHVGDRRIQTSPLAISSPFQQSSSQPFVRPDNDARGFLQKYSTPVTASKRQLTFGISPVSPLLQPDSRTHNHGHVAGATLNGSPRKTGLSFLAPPQPPTPAGSPFDTVSTKHTQWRFEFPTTWQEFEQRGIQYFGINGANLSSLGGQPPPPETARLVTPVDPKFPKSGISNPGWSDLQLRRIAFLPNTLRLDASSLTGEIIYFLRQFGVSFDDMIARASTSDTEVSWECHRKRLKERETQYRQTCKGGWARGFRVRLKGKMTEDSKPRLIGPDAFTEEQYLFNVCWNVDVNSQTMWPPVGPSARYPLPPPQIDPAIEKMLKDESMIVPDFNWLRAKYSRTSLPPAQSIASQEGFRATVSGEEEETAQFPSSSKWIQSSEAAPSSLVTPAKWTLQPTTVIDDQLVYIFGEPIPRYPHVHDGWQGPSTVIIGTGYCEMQDRYTYRTPHLIPPHVQSLMAQAKNATDRWRASKLPRGQAASLPSAESIQASNSFGIGSSDRYLENPGASQQSFMVSNVQSYQNTSSSQYESLDSLIDEVVNGQGDNIMPSSNVRTILSEDDQIRSLRNSNRAVYPASSQSRAEFQGQTHRQSDISLQRMPSHLGTDSLLSGQDFGMPHGMGTDSLLSGQDFGMPHGMGTDSLLSGQDFGMPHGKGHGPSFHHSFVVSRTQSNQMAQSGGEEQGLEFFGTSSTSEIHSRSGMGLDSGAYAAERLGPVDGFANRGMEGFNSDSTDVGSLGAMMRPGPFTGNPFDPRASSQSIRPTLSDGTVGRGDLVVGGIREESPGEFVRFWSASGLAQQPEAER